MNERENVVSTETLEKAFERVRKAEEEFSKYSQEQVDKRIFAVVIVDSFAPGCGLTIIPFLVFKARSILKMVVDVGFVVGIIAEITPTGSAIFLYPPASSSYITPQVFSSLYLLYIYSVL